jgi:hypothetical protein
MIPGKIQRQLNQPYPCYYDSWRTILKLTIILIISVTFFLYLFQPFTVNFDEHKFSWFFISLFRGLLVGSVFLLFTAILRVTVPEHLQDQNWTVGRELLFITAVLLLIGLGNFFLRELIYDNPDNFSLRYFRAEVGNTFLVGFLFAVIGVMINYMHLLKSTARKAKTWDDLISKSQQQPPVDPEITISAESPQDVISFRLDAFLYAVVDGNYVEFFLRDENDQVKRYITRNTLKNVEKQLNPHQNMIRVHRSFLVNLNKIESVKGNAQGYKLSLSGVEMPIPVSRGYISEFDRAISRRDKNSD